MISARLPSARRLLAFWLALAALALSGSVRAADAPPPSSAPSVARGEENVSPDAMKRSVRDVLGRREFAWRNPRAATPPPVEKDEPPGPVARFFKKLSDKIGEWFDAVRRWFRTNREKPVEERPESSGPGVGGIGAALQPILYGLLIALAVVGMVLLVRALLARRAARALSGKTLSGAPAALPDLTDEAVLADQLPEDEWLSLARSLLARGEHRLALRAFYLSVLSGLGGRGLLGIARHKSNRDYQGELRRRARDRAGLQEIFGRLVGRFERVWYGSYPADDGLLAAFQDDRERLTAELPGQPAPGGPTHPPAVPIPA